MTHGEYLAYLERRVGKQTLFELHTDHEWIRPITDRIEKSRIIDSRFSNRSVSINPKEIP